MKSLNSVSLTQFCEDLGAKRRNPQWSWCSISPARDLALFTIWEDRIENGRYEFTTKPRASDKKKKAGRTELVSVLDEVIQNGIAAYGISCRVVDIDANPRKVKSFNSDYLMDLRVRREGQDYLGQIVGHIPPQVIIERGSNAAWIASAAINDIDQDEVGNSDPEYRKRMSGSYVRDAKVRKLVLKRAKGVCEECGQAGFPKVGGEPYLETHHVINLSEQGADKPHNVIALCATDHRRAHYANDWAELQDRFLAKLSKFKTDD